MRQPLKPAPDNPLFAELVAIHSLIRGDLAKVTLLAEDAAGGDDGGEIAQRIAELKASTMLWQLKLGCLQHCRFVHGHHNLEDAAIFPTLRRVDPELSSVVDRLEREHREVAMLLGGVERTAIELGSGPAGTAARRRLVVALERLGELLLDHLDFEEQSLESALARMPTWRG